MKNIEALCLWTVALGVMNREVKESGNQLLYHLKANEMVICGICEVHMTAA